MVIRNLIIASLVLSLPVHAGLAWQKQKSGVTTNLKSVQFIDSLNGFCSGDSAFLLKTTDGGKNWITIPNIPWVDSTDVTTLKFQFVNKNIGWIFPWGNIWKTTDAGKTWIRQCQYNSYLLLPKFMDPFIGWCIQVDGLYKTTDGGNTWALSKTGTMGVDYCFYDFDANVAWVTYNFCPNGTWNLGFYSTKDGGKTWGDSGVFPLPTYSASPSKKLGLSLIDTYVSSAIECTYICSTSINRSIDGGKSWQQINEPGFFHPQFALHWTYQYSDIRSLKICDDGSCWMFNKSQSPGSTLLFTSGDTASTWQEQPLPDKSINAIFKLNNNLGWIVGDSGKIYCYFDTSARNPVNQPISSQKSLEMQISGIIPNTSGRPITILYQIPLSGTVSLSIYNSSGQQIENLYTCFSNAGSHKITWNTAGKCGKSLSKGIYFCVLQIQSSSSVKSEKAMQFMIR
jgi:photosystem II stability/assembly factor-like uncharacterized protein